MNKLMDKAVRRVEYEAEQLQKRCDSLEQWFKEIEREEKEKSLLWGIACFALVVSVTALWRTL